MFEYQVMRQLAAEGLRPREKPEAAKALGALGHGRAETSPSLDRELLQASQTTPDPLPLLCLRCRVSHPLEAWLRATHAQFSRQYGLELMAMASYALDDDGSLTIRKGPSEKVPFTYAEIASRPVGLISPFSAEVIRTYDPSRCGLPHWARLKIQAHNGLKAYFRQNGLLLISDWALLRNSSPRRVREACERHLRSGTTIERLLELHGRYLPLYDEVKAAYKARTGKASGWQPELAFLRQLDPQMDPFATQEELLALAKALRQWLTSRAETSLDQAAEQGFEAADPSSLADPEADAPSPEDLRGLIDTALMRAMDAFMAPELAKEAVRFRTSPDKEKAWRLFGEGLTQRDIGEQCGHKQAWVSRLLKEKVHATAIATAAAVELKRHAAFASCGQSVEAAERLVGGLRNHLLEPEREGEVAPLRQWVHRFLSQP